jgi:hypothetical protein
MMKYYRIVNEATGEVCELGMPEGYRSECCRVAYMRATSWVRELVHYGTPYRQAVQAVKLYALVDDMVAWRVRLL